MRTTPVSTDGGRPVWTKHAEGAADRIRLADEHRALTALRHPNVVEPVGFDGSSLTTALAGRTDLAATPPRDREEIAEIAEAMAVILGELHRMGWTHGAIGPAHLIRGPGGRLVLCSLGRARQVDDPAAAGRGADRRALAEMIRRWLVLTPPAPSGQDRAATRRIRRVVAELDS